MNRIIETADGFDIEVNGTRHGSWRSRAEASAGLFVEEQRARRRKAEPPVLKPAAPQQIWLVEAEHTEVPGRKLACFSTEAGAREYAATLRKEYRGKMAWVIVEPLVLDSTDAKQAAA